MREKPVGHFQCHSEIRSPCWLLPRPRAMDHLWASLPDELRQLVVVAYVRDATSYDLALVAPLSPAFLTAVRDARERRTTPWWGGPWHGFGPNPNLSAPVNERGFWNQPEDHYLDPPLTPAELDRRILARACDSGDLEVVQRQIAKGTALDFTSCYDTPLYLAVGNGHPTCVRALLVARASLLDVCGEDRGAGIFSLALYKGHLDVVKVLTEFGVPRWGRAFTDDGDGELWAAEYCGIPDGPLTQEIEEFLVATRKYNPRAGDPDAYIRLQAEDKLALLMDGSEEQQLDGVRGLDFLAWSHNGFSFGNYHHDLFVQTTRDLLPSLRTAVKANRFEGKVLAAVLELIEHIELAVVLELIEHIELGDENEQLEEKLSHDQWDPVPERASLWAELKELLSDYPNLRTYLVLPEDMSAASTGEVGAATGALKELLQQRPASVSDDELQFLLRQSPEECLEARLGITEAAEHEADVGERARLVFLARVAELGRAACRLHRGRLSCLQAPSWSAELLAGSIVVD